jgi:transcriptional regulator with GAF, ATPase, and Fis domain
MTTLSLTTRRERLDRSVIVAELKRQGWNKDAAARKLGMWPSSLRWRIKTLGLADLCAQHKRGPGRPRKERT